MHGPPPQTRPASRALRAALFTDTLADVNGVARFIRNVADLSLAQGRELTVITSTRLPAPSAPNIINLPPVFSRAMPGYADLQLALPPLARTLALARALRPHVIHVSTPGPVGLAGLLAARTLRVPVVGVYHTDFPAYVERLVRDDSLAWFTKAAMSAVYSRFAAVFARSADTAAALTRLGIAPQRIRPLRPGIVTGRFHPRFADEPFVRSLGIAPGSLRLLYAGRVSTEKNLPFLASLWRRAAPLLASRGINAQLVIVGDGPCREQLQRTLPDAVFTGFRHGSELAALYASSHLFVFPSTTDTLGQVVMEAQASGLPVLVSNLGGPRDVVGHDRTGLVLPADNLPAWLDALVTLALNHNRRTEMSRAAHLAMQPFDMHTSFDHFWSVHEEVALSPAPRTHARRPGQPRAHARATAPSPR